MRGALVVLRKELIDTFRDVRSMLMVLFIAVLGPVGLVVAVGALAGWFGGGPVRLDHKPRAAATKTITIPVEGGARAPGLIEFLHHQNIETRPAPTDAAAAVRDGKESVVLIIPEGYSADFASGHTASVRLVTDRAKTSTVGTFLAVQTALTMYAEMVGALRLVARGVSPAVVSALAVAVDDVATPESDAANILGAIVPVCLMLAIFVGGLATSVEITAGERERGSLEPLLATPVSSTQIVLGKLGAVYLLSLGTLLLTLTGFVIVENLPLPEVPGLRFRSGVGWGLEACAALVPVVLPAAAFQMLVGNMSRTVKEAQTTAAIAPIAPLVVQLVMAFAPFKSARATLLVPLASQNALMEGVLRAAPMHPVDYLLAASTTTLLGVVLAGFAVATCAHARMLR